MLLVKGLTLSYSSYLPAAAAVPLMTFDLIVNLGGLCALCVGSRAVYVEQLLPVYICESVRLLAQLIRLFSHCIGECIV